jgi:hypothetical protein
MMPTQRILSMDGGYGWNTATLLQMVSDRIRAETGDTEMLDHVDLFTGVSAGGINSLFFASKENPSQAIGDIVQFWQQVNQSALRGLLPPSFMAGVNPAQVLQGDPHSVNRLLSNVQAAMPGAASSSLFSPENLWKLPELLWNLWGAGVRLGLAATGAVSVFSSFDLRQFFIDYFGATTTLGNLKHKVAITAFQLDDGAPPPHRAWKPKVFQNYRAENGVEPDLNELVVDVAMRTAAAPVEEPIFQSLSGSGPGYVDGGLVANNSSMIGLAQALSTGIDMKEILLLSVSTGRNLVYDIQYLDPNFVNGVAPWGYFQWLLNPWKPLALLELAIEGGSEAVHYQVTQLLGEQRYYRLNPPIRNFQVPDDPTTREFVDETVNFLRSSGWLDTDHYNQEALRVRRLPVSPARLRAKLRSEQQQAALASPVAVTAGAAEAAQP